MLYLFGSRQIRNRATMGGNIVTASPIGDSAPVLLALDATVVLASIATEKEVSSENGSGKGISERRLPISEFFVSYRKTALQPGEILRSIIVPRPFAERGITRRVEWYKVSKRREM